MEEKELESKEYWTEKLCIRPLTVLCGINEIGKSTAIRAIKPNYVHDKPENGCHPSVITSNTQELCKLVAANKNADSVTCIETHSEYVVGGLQLAVLKDIIPNTDIAINFLYQEACFVEVTHIFITEKGELTEWPKGFFDQLAVNFVEMINLRKSKFK